LVSWQVLAAVKSALILDAVSRWSAQAWAYVGIGLAILILQQGVENDPSAALAAGILLLLSAGACLAVLRLPLLSAPLAYLCVFGVFHLGFVLPWALGVSGLSTPAWVSTYRLAPALRQVGLALWCFQLGATVAAASGGLFQSVHAGKRYRNGIVCHCGLGVVAVAVAAFGWGLRSFGIGEFMDANYTETYRLAAWHDPRFFMTSLTVAPIGFYLAVAAAPWRRLKLVLCLLAGWAGLVFFLGFRGHALVPLLATAVILRQRGLSLPRWVWTACLAGLLAAIPAARSWRDHRLAERSLSDALANVRPLAAVEEMGGSLEPLVHTLRLMETERYRLGETYWQAAKRVLPNLASEWRGNVYLPLGELPPTHWVTRQAAPWKHDHFGGIGFSAVAEPYMNFGSIGVAFYFLLLGFALVRADALAAGRPTRLAVLAAVLGPLLWTARGSFDSFFRPAVWGVLCVLAARVVADSLRATGRGMSARTPPRQTALRAAVTSQEAV
jgi:hypothetical protein